ncbi:hypothetical protein BB561_002077 [Smittium simulii]|uniref:CCHC-type domain-containing protein n=1 Tax=Smittium simulii TaxID=133385 RepID=A0A2T9YRS6_9FUNG|nr:hypothetical protein BB561_002077 [Smittium simulii]
MSVNKLDSLINNMRNKIAALDQNIQHSFVDRLEVKDQKNYSILTAKIVDFDKEKASIKNELTGKDPISDINEFISAFEDCMRINGLSPHVHGARLISSCLEYSDLQWLRNGVPSSLVWVNMIPIISEIFGDPEKESKSLLAMWNMKPLIPNQGAVKKFIISLPDTIKWSIEAAIIEKRSSSDFISVSQFAMRFSNSSSTINEYATEKKGKDFKKEKVYCTFHKSNSHNTSDCYTIKNKTSNKAHNIHASTSNALKCFKCGSTQHLANTCTAKNNLHIKKISVNKCPNKNKNLEKQNLNIEENLCIKNNEIKKIFVNASSENDEFKFPITICGRKIIAELDTAAEIRLSRVWDHPMMLLLSTIICLNNIYLSALIGLLQGLRKQVLVAFLSVTNVLQASGSTEGSVSGSYICGGFLARLISLCTVSILSYKIVVAKSDRSTLMPKLLVDIETGPALFAVVEAVSYTAGVSATSIVLFEYRLNKVILDITLVSPQNDPNYNQILKLIWSFPLTTPCLSWFNNCVNELKAFGFQNEEQAIFLMARQLRGNVRQFYDSYCDANEGGMGQLKHFKEVMGPKFIDDNFDIKIKYKPLNLKQSGSIAKTKISDYDIDIDVNAIETNTKNDSIDINPYQNPIEHSSSVNQKLFGQRHNVLEFEEAKHKSTQEQSGVGESEDTPTPIDDKVVIAALINMPAIKSKDMHEVMQNSLEAPYYDLDYYTAEENKREKTSRMLKRLANFSEGLIKRKPKIIRLENVNKCFISLKAAKILSAKITKVKPDSYATVANGNGIELEEIAENSINNITYGDNDFKNIIECYKNTFKQANFDQIPDRKVKHIIQTTTDVPVARGATKVNTSSLERENKYSICELKNPIDLGAKLTSTSLEPQIYLRYRRQQRGSRAVLLQRNKITTNGQYLLNKED